jgi:hypothetical protein
MRNTAKLFAVVPHSAFNLGGISASNLFSAIINELNFLTSFFLHFGVLRSVGDRSERASGGAFIRR